jgi:hypothetical protein
MSRIKVNSSYHSNERNVTEYSIQSVPFELKQEAGVAEWRTLWSFPIWMKTFAIDARVVTDLIGSPPMGFRATSTNPHPIRWRQPLFEAPND